MTVYRIQPIGKPRMTQRDKWQQRPAVVAYRAFKDACREQGMFIPAQCMIVFNIAMPVSWSKKHRASMNGQPHQQKPDLDNMLKAVMDAVHEDDAHIWAVKAEKRWAETPSIEIREIS